MPQLDFDGANSKISADKIQGQSGTTVTIPAGHNLAGDGSGLTSLSAANLTGTVADARISTLTSSKLSGALPAIDGSSLTGVGATDSKFCLYMAAIESNITGDGTAFPIKDANMSSTSWTEVYDTGNHVSGGMYTAPETGKYILSGIFHINSLTNSHDISYAKIRTSNRYYTIEGDWSSLSSANAWLTIPLTVVADMDAGDDAWMEVTVSRSGKTVEVGSTSPGKTWFTGALLA
jgi:hypothetical protein